jgi:hypothetical protein
MHTGDNDPFAQIRARNGLVRTVRDSLKGSGLDIRERRNELVISHPGHPEHGRIYVTLASGEVSHARTTWTYLGPLHGHEPNDDPDRDPPITADTIITTLGARPSPPPP